MADLERVLRVNVENRVPHNAGCNGRNLDAAQVIRAEAAADRSEKGAVRSEAAAARSESAANRAENAGAGVAAQVQLAQEARAGAQQSEQNAAESASQAAATLAGAVQSVPSAADVSDFSGAAEQLRISDSPLIGGSFIPSPLSTALVDGGTILLRAAGGRWLRQSDGIAANPFWWGAIGDGSSHPLSSRYATLADAKNAFPLVAASITSLSIEIDWCAVQSAINARGNVFVPRKKYRMTLPIALTGDSPELNCEQGTIFDFVLASNTEDLISLQPANYGVAKIANLQIDANATGRDALDLGFGRPQLHNLRINDAYRDAVASTTDGLYQWVENFHGVGVEVNGVGRHALHMTLKGAGSFFNESTLDGFEVRGVGRRFADASAWRVTFDGSSGGAKVSGFSGRNWNFDADHAGCVKPLSHTVSVKSINGGQGGIECWGVSGGGWESISEPAPSGLLNVHVDSTIACSDVHFERIVSAGWGYGASPSLLGADNCSYADANGKFHARALSRPNGVAIQGDSYGSIRGFRNEPTAYRGQLYIAAGVVAQKAIKVANPANGTTLAPLIVFLHNRAYTDGLGLSAWGVYLVSVTNREGVKRVDAQVMMASNNNHGASFDPATVGFSIDDETGDLIVSVTGMGGAGSSGASTLVHITASPGFVNLPGVYEDAVIG